MEVTGQVFLIGDKKQVTDNMQKQEIIVKTNEQYPQHIKVEFVNAKCDLLNGINVNDTVTISINLRGNLSKDSTTAYVSCQGWKLSKI
jgi:hypothetical protein